MKRRPVEGSRRIGIIWLIPAVSVAALGGVSAAWMGSGSNPSFASGSAAREALIPEIGGGSLDLKASEKRLLEYLKSHPKDIRALCALGRVYADGGRTKEAKAAYEKALALNPNHADSLQGMAELHSSMGRHDLAISFWNRACRASPGDFRVWRGLGLSAYQSKDYLLAMTAIQRSLKENPDQEDLRALQLELALGEGDLMRSGQAGPAGVPGFSSRPASDVGVPDPLRHLPENLRPRIPR